MTINQKIINRERTGIVVVDIQAKFVTKNLVDVPLRSKDRVFGVLCAMNKKTGAFDKTDVELLNMLEPLP